MYATLYPEWAQKQHSSQHRKRVMLPPDGDPTNPDIRSAEVVFDAIQMSDHSVIAHFAVFRPTPEDIARLQDGGLLELCILGEGVQPFSLITIHEHDEPRT